MKDTAGTRRLFLTGVLLICVSFAALGQEGKAAFDAWVRWKSSPENAQLGYGESLDKYKATLIADGASEEAAARTIRLIAAHDEGTLYDRIYSGAPTFNRKPNALLVAAVANLRPGRALDVGMGQGRNAIYLASRGWDVTGFDVSQVGLDKAKEQAAAEGVKVNTVLASDEEFGFGRDRWDLIAIIYAIEKRSIYRVRDALRPGGVVVVEAGINEAPDASFGYRPGELKEIFSGFDILQYEETTDEWDWGDERIPLVRLVARKP